MFLVDQAGRIMGIRNTAVAPPSGVLLTILQNDNPQGSATNEAGYILSHYKNNLGIGARFWVFGTQNQFSGYCNQDPTVFGYPKGTS